MGADPVPAEVVAGKRWRRSNLLRLGGNPGRVKLSPPSPPGRGLGVRGSFLPSPPASGERGFVFVYVSRNGMHFVTPTGTAPAAPRRTPPANAAAAPSSAPPPPAA